MKPTDFAIRLRAFLSNYLPTQRKLSPNTISSYRYAFILLLRYCSKVRKLQVEQLDFKQIDVPLVLDFLEYLDRERKCTAQTQNHRLAAIHSFFRYVQVENPEVLAQCQRMLAIPLRRTSHVEPTYLSPEDLAILLKQPDMSTRDGRRNAMMLSLLYDTGARVQELIDIDVGDLRLSMPSTVRLRGKGQKVRLVPLMPTTARVLADYLRALELDDTNRGANEPLFRNQRGARFSRWGIRYIVKKYCDQARIPCPTLPTTVTPHTLRHTKAMHLLQAGNPAIIIRDILGHADIQSTEVYAKADLEMKRRALEKAGQTAPPTKLRSWQRKPDLLGWLESL